MDEWMDIYVEYLLGRERGGRDDPDGELTVNTAIDP